ncbi:MAG: carotenoid oxygenase family protein [Pseudomonadota bacterium]|nr:carotenoid oxygenase family protein [Pseudomonadota bacterium]
MNRRHLLQALAVAGLLPATLRAAHAKAAHAVDFDIARVGQPLLAPMAGVTDVSGVRDAAPLATTGRWPHALRGRFYRNGPALFERGSGPGRERYRHWFDGDGMVQQYTLADGRISHRGRLVQTTKLSAERDAGRFLFPTFGTAIEGGPPITGADSINVANTNALEHAGRVLALWEGGSAYALDPVDLSTRGPVTWRDDLAGLPFTAHPKVDAAGHLWNLGTFGPHLMAWHIGPDGKLIDFQLGTSPYPGGMVHDLAITERYFVVPLPPVQLDFSRPVGDGARRFALEAGQPLRILVMEKADITKRRVFELPPAMVFHVGNAHEEADGTVVLSFATSPDATFLDRGAVEIMSGQPLDSGQPRLAVARMNLQSGRITLDQMHHDIEFPRIHPQRIGISGAGRARWLVSGAAWKLYASRQHALLHGVQLTDLQTGRVRRYDYGDQAIAEEHIVLPKPGQRGELDAWLLGTTFDARRQTTVLNLLDAAHIEDGPVAQAFLPYTLPLGFHGNFTAT